MSDWSKRKFKDLDTRKKFKRDYINKEEKQLRYRDKKYQDDSWHEDKKCCDKKDKCKREKNDTVTEFDVSQSITTSGALIRNDTSLTNLTNISTSRVLDQVKVDVDDEDNEVLLQGTVEWTPDSVALTVAILAAVLNTVVGTGATTIPLSVQATIRVWKSEDGKHNGPSLPIFETTDTASLAAFTVPLALVFGTTTTSFQFVDKNPDCGKNRYYSTIEVNVYGTGSVELGIGTSIPILELLFPDGVKFKTDVHVLTATEIADKDKH